MNGKDVGLDAVKLSQESSLLGERVEVALDRGTWIEALVVAEDTGGKVVVRDDDGFECVGWDYQLRVLGK